MIEKFIGATHLILLTPREGSNDARHVEHVESALLLGQVVDTILNTPPNILVRLGLEQIKSLRQPRDSISVEIRRRLTQIVLIMGQKLINLLLLESFLVAKMFGHI